MITSFSLSLPEYSGPMSAQYQAYFLQPMLEYIKDKQPEVRQAAVYGCGVLAQVGNLALNSNEHDS